MEGCVFLDFAPVVGTCQYDWSKKQIFVLSILELGAMEVKAWLDA
jgi:hypothetical protein